MAVMHHSDRGTAGRRGHTALRVGAAVGPRVGTHHFSGSFGRDTHPAAGTHHLRTGGDTPTGDGDTPVVAGTHQLWRGHTTQIAAEQAGGDRAGEPSRMGTHHFGGSFRRGTGDGDTPFGDGIQHLAGTHHFEGRGCRGLGGARAQAGNLIRQGLVTVDGVAADKAEGQC